MEAIHFLQSLLQVNSSNPPGNEHRVAEIFQKRCRKLGISHRIDRLEETRSNFIVEYKGGSPRKLLLCGHMDTVIPGEVEWEYSPYSGEIVGSRIYGRGASDMKSGLAAMYLALEELILEKAELPLSVEFLATAGEEVDSCGAIDYVNHDHSSDIEAIIIGEPTNEKIVIGHKGALWLEIVTFGKTAHGSMPGQGINAIHQMMKVIELLDDLKLQWKMSNQLLGDSSMAVTKINGGIQTNVIPDRCSLQVDIRTVPPQSHQNLIKELKERLDSIKSQDSHFEFEIIQLLDRSSIITKPEATLIKCALELKEKNIKDCYGVSYYTDGAVLNPHSLIPTLIYGPGDEKLAHQPNEWVDIDAYTRAIRFYKNLIVKFCSYY
ncbi:M20 family metallopeptidase [Neobacillus mesonae]|uniref:Probable succinyl-diaminopimelate desuccinylase n=1 Tax=Neobacillus mesonae TaxID=1193713 RepID=A0A3T0HYC8_9BACI|nr:M20 family metallopeptidase [Neobacillus mesonae]AZU62125.1 acetylornithine deacetylase [Neobacillus mesonae]